MSTKLFIVDASNMLMRAAFGGEIPPAQAVPIASTLISRAAFQIKASHMVLALDNSLPSWRKIEYPDYKANRTVDTDPWLKAAHEYWTRLGWYVEDCGGYEADDIIATLSKRACAHSQVTVLSGDSDLLPLISLGVSILKPLNGGTFALVTPADIQAKYKISSAAVLTDFKSMTGESGDNIPGVPGIGPVRAAKLLNAYDSLEGTITAGHIGKSKDAVTVARHELTARRAYKLLSLSFDAPIAPVNPKNCVFSPH